MDERPYLGELEQTILWAICRLGEEAYGATIITEIAERVGRVVTPGALYATLDRLEEKGVIASTLAAPEPGRGGRRKRLVAITHLGRTALAETRSRWLRLWDGLDAALET